jgi:hypothetical protein
MAISGDTLKDFTFEDDTGNRVLITLSIKDGLYFKLIERLTQAIRGLE